MRLKLTLARSDGSSDDIVVTADAAAPIEELARAIADRDPRGEPIAPGHRLTLRRFAGGGQSPAWSLLPPTAQVSEDWLASGAVVALGDPEPTRGSDGATAVAMLEVLNGEQQGVTVPLTPGDWIVGRNPDSDIRLSDPLVSWQHARLQVSETIEVVDLGSANGVFMDGDYVARHELVRDQVLAFGGAEVRIRFLSEERSVVSPRKAGAPALHLRSPRVEPRFAGERFKAPDVPVESEPNPFPWLAMVAPILLGVSMALILDRWAMLLFCLLSPVMLLGNFVMNRKKEQRALARSIHRFEERLGRLSGDLVSAAATEQRTRLREAPATAEVVEAALQRSPLLWTRRPEHWSFLHLRLGLGAMPSRSSIETPARGEMIPEFQERLDALLERHRDVPDVPVVESLYEAGALGCAGPADLLASLVNGMVAQLVGLHAPSEVALAAIVSPAWGSELGWVKWLPHTSSPQSPLGAVPHLADSPSSAAGLVSAIEALIAERSAAVQRRGALALGQAALERGAEVGERRGEETAGGTKSPVPALVVLVSSDAPVDRARLVQLSEAGADAGVFPIWFGPDAASLPAACRTLVEARGPGIGAVAFVRLGRWIDPVRLESLPRGQAEVLGRSLAKVVDAGAVVADNSDVPHTVPMAELIGHDYFESPGAVVGRWTENDSMTDRQSITMERRRVPGKLRALVGSIGSEPMHLDLRAQGPHALVGGTTGSGKSEFLQAWVLGMAVEYSPDRVTFLFVDYKGGSAFADCVRLPHCVGLVTDLSPHLVRRALTSLRAELHHREHLFNRKQARDLLELERRGDPDAPPALVIVIDEFAALAGDVPEFVDGVIDIAQRGRSLGIHLIMATQRPAGVIRDNLRANTNLRVALRMADDADSNDVVGVADAARFDPGIPGRAMAKTGPGRLQQFQAAYAGGWTRRGEQQAEVTVADLRFGGESAWQPRTAADVALADEDLGPNDQQRLVATVVAASEQAAIPPPRRPWLDELPRLVDIASLLTGDDAAIPLGLSDEPAAQRRVPAVFRPDEDGHIAFFGTGGSGKTVALRTLATATAVTSAGGPVHVYALDFAGGALRMLEGLPHVGAVISGEDAERVQRLLRRVRGELEGRAKRYSAVAASNIVEYRQQAGRPDEPRLLLLIDGFPSFREEWDLAIGRSAWYDVVKGILAGGRQLGIHIAFTADRPGAVPTSVSSVVQGRVVLRLSDEQAYRAAGVPKDVLGDESAPGRAFVDGLETQLGVLGAGEAVATASDQAGALTDYVERHRGLIPVAPPVESLPTLIPAAQLPATIEGRPVLGVSDETLTPTGFEASGTFLLSGPPLSGRSNALAWLTRSLAALGEERTFVYFGNSRSALAADAVFSRRATNADDALVLAKDLAAEIAGGAGTRYAIVVEGIGDYLQTPADSALVELIKQVKRHDHFLLAENEVAGWGGSWPLFAEVKNGRRGLLLQPDPAEGEILLKTTTPRAARSEFPPGRGMYIEKGKAIRVQLPEV